MCTLFLFADKDIILPIVIICVPFLTGIVIAVIVYTIIRRRRRQKNRENYREVQEPTEDSPLLGKYPDNHMCTPRP